MESLNAIAEEFGFPVIVSTHPRTRKLLDEESWSINSLVQFLKPLGFSDYNALQLNSCAVLSDSGTISEEASILGFRALNIRESHERPEAMEEAAVMMVGLGKERILQGLAEIEGAKGEENRLLSVTDYSSSNVSLKVVRIIISYIDYVNNTVWKKEPK